MSRALPAANTEDEAPGHDDDGFGGLDIESDGDDAGPDAQVLAGLFQFDSWSSDESPRALHNQRHSKVGR